MLNINCTTGKYVNFVILTDSVQTQLVKTTENHKSLKIKHIFNEFLSHWCKGTEMLLPPSIHSIQKYIFIL